MAETDFPETPRQDEAKMTETVNDAAATNRHVLTLLVCPLTRAPLRYDAKAQELISPAAELAYPIKDGVPIMTETAARPLSEAEVARLKAKRPGQHQSSA